MSFTELLENFHRSADPQYARDIDKARSALQDAGLWLTAVAVGSVAFGVIGISLTCGGGVGAALGTSLILVTLPLGYLSFNGTKVSKNLSDILNNPKEYITLKGFGKLDKQKIKKKVEEETYCFHWIVDAMVDKMIK